MAERLRREHSEYIGRLQKKRKYMGGVQQTGAGARGHPALPGTGAPIGSAATVRSGLSPYRGIFKEKLKMLPKCPNYPSATLT
eukprot:9024088-Pyramimonas_sp.AAC.1